MMVRRTPNFPHSPALVIMVRTGQKGLPNPYRGVPVSADIVPKRKGLRFGSQLVMGGPCLLSACFRPTAFSTAPYGRRSRAPHRGAASGWWRTHGRSEEHTSELQSLMRISYAVFCLKKKKKKDK